ncbi:MAG TPA: hypothetical protein PL070_08735, partial [Flavobacteriales bacterium]|nr:hypothetical protein [Flavobacteriales bacterium]
MILDDLYIALRDRLTDPAKPSLGIRTIDWSNGQAEAMEMNEPVQEPLNLPAVLVRYEKPEWQARGRKHYEAEGVIYLDVVQLMVDDPLTSDRDPLLVAETRETYTNVHEIAKRCIGMRGQGYGTVGLTGYEQDHSFAKLRVDTITLRSLLCTDMDPTTWLRRPVPALVINEVPTEAPPSGRTVIVRNSDRSYNATITAPSILELPDVPHVNSNGVTTPRPALTPFVADLCDIVTPGTVQLYDSANQPIGSAVTVNPGASIPLTAPDGTVSARNSLGTAVTALTPVRSGGHVDLPIADSVITRPDGSTVNLPATLPSDVRNMRSGINYALSEAMWSGQVTAYAFGDEGTFYALYQYLSVIHPYPAQVAQLGNTWTTLLSLNKWGDHRRFTDRLGTEVYADGIIHDHLYDLWWYRPATLAT